MTQVTTLDRALGELRHNWAGFLPDGRHFLYLATSNQPQYDDILYVGSLDSNEPRTMLFHADSQAVYVRQAIWSSCWETRSSPDASTRAACA